LVGIALAFITLIFEYWYYKNKDPEDQVAHNNSNSRAKQIEVKQFAGDKATINREADSATAYRLELNINLNKSTFTQNDKLINRSEK
jgi:hypothetical protein